MRVQLERVSRRPSWPLWSVAVVGGWLALVGAAVWLSDQVGRELQLCMFKRLTGLPCPTCGATRGVLSILHGRVLQGWAFNPLVLTILLVWAVAVLCRLLFRRGVTVRLSRTDRVIAWAAAVSLVIANWAYVIRYVG